MRVAERHVASKTGRAHDCEDGIAVTGGHAAVIDGATDKTGLRFGGLTGGRAVMQACAEALQDVDERADAREAIGAISARVASLLPEGLDPRDRPEAAMVVFSHWRREIWQIGDVGFWYAGLRAAGARPRKLVDRHAAAIRAAVTCAELAAGVSRDEVTRSDPGRAAIASLLRSQAVFRNNPGAGPWAYGAIDGSEVPGQFVTVIAIPEQVSELVIASDGYPHIGPTLAQSEQRLAELLDADPLCVGVLSGTKGVAPGNVSFDDRAYLRIEW